MEDVKMGRPSHEPSEESYDLVKSMVKDGATKKYMAKVLELDYKTFMKHYGHVIEGVKKEGRKKVAKAVAELAEAGDVKAAIFLLQQAKNEDQNFFELENVSDDPIDFLTKVFQNENIRADIRVKAAISVAPYKASKVAAQGIKEGQKSDAARAAKTGKFSSLSAGLAKKKSEGELPS